MIAECSRVLQANLQAAAHELVRRNTPRGGDRQADIAEAVGMALGRFSQVLNAPGTPLPAHLAVQLHRELKDDFLTQAICHACDGFFVPLSAESLSIDQARGAFETAMDRLSSVMQESGEARRGKAWHGTAGMAWPGTARPGTARQGMARRAWQGWAGRAGQGEARRGTAGRGLKGFISLNGTGSQEGTER